MICNIIMVSIVNEKGFYYMKHHIQKKEKRRYLGKSIPKDIKQQKEAFLKEFYCEGWDKDIQKIVKNYKKENKNIPKKIESKNFESFGIAFTYNTHRIEGSTLTESDTKDLLVHGLTPSKKSPTDTIETQKHYELFMKLVTSKKLSKITKYTLLEWHNAVFDQTMAVGEAGRFRTHQVGVTANPNIDFTTVSEIPKRIKEFFNWLNKYNPKINPIEFAALTHYKLVSIHPFSDGNGKISRLIMNYICFKYDCPFMLIKNIDKKGYYKSLEKSQLNNDEIYFLKWFMKYYIKMNKKYLK